MHHSSPRLSASLRPGLVTPLRSCPDDYVAPFLGLRHGQAHNARPPAPKLPQPEPRVDSDLIHVAPTAAASAVPNWNRLPLRYRNLCGMVGVVLPFRNKGKSGTLPSIRSQGATYRMIGVGNC